MQKRIFKTIMIDQRINKSYSPFSDSDEIHSFYNKLARKKSRLMKIETIGSSVEERNIIIVKINVNKELPAVIIDAGDC